jgi:hypothetical protein
MAMRKQRGMAEQERREGDRGPAAPQVRWGEPRIRELCKSQRSLPAVEFEQGQKAADQGLGSYGERRGQGTELIGPLMSLFS